MNDGTQARMTHPQIEEEQILDRYLAGRLAEDEEALFEEHLFECRACLAQAEAGEELRRGVRAVAAEAAGEAVRTTAALGFVAWLRTRSPAVRGAFGALGLALVVLPLLLTWQGLALREAREAAQQAAVAPPVAPPASTGFEAPFGDFQMVSLGVVRGGTPEPVVIRVDRTREAVLLSLELPEGTASRYRVTLLRASGASEGEAVWRGEALEPNLYETLLVALPVDFLEPGAYRIHLEALREGGAEPAGELAFRVAAETGN
jgi:hypothetical protein